MGKVALSDFLLLWEKGYIRDQVTKGVIRAEAECLWARAMCHRKGLLPTPQKIAEQKPDIIILDVYMPGYTGLEVCEKVRGSMETLKPPVLLTVGKIPPRSWKMIEDEMYGMIPSAKTVAR